MDCRDVHVFGEDRGGGEGLATRRALERSLACDVRRLGCGGENLALTVLFVSSQSRNLALTVLCVPYVRV